LILETWKMSRLQKRLQIYSLISTFLILILWLKLPHTRSQVLHHRRAPRESPGRPKLSSSSPNQVKKTHLDPSERQWLKTLFKKADTTADGLLSLHELTFGIHQSVGKHVQQAMRSNPRTFFSLDKINHNGQVEWEEWLARFNKEHGIQSDRPQDLSRGLKEKLAAAKAAWSEAARSNPDALNIDEFLSFAHPESSHSALAQQMEELIGRYDLDGDGKVSLQEYLQDAFIEFTPSEAEIRHRQFIDQIDANGDGQADRRELLTFLDPKHISQSKSEAIRLISLADLDGDGFLEWNELNEQAQEFLDSKWVSPEKSFHWDL